MTKAKMTQNSDYTKTRYSRLLNWVLAADSFSRITWEVFRSIILNQSSVVQMKCHSIGSEYFRLFEFSNVLHDSLPAMDGNRYATYVPIYRENVQVEIIYWAVPGWCLFTGLGTICWEINAIKDDTKSHNMEYRIYNKLVRFFTLIAFCYFLWPEKTSKAFAKSILSVQWVQYMANSLDW